MVQWLVCRLFSLGDLDGGGLNVEAVLLDFLQGEDIEAKVWKLLSWANVPNHTHVFCRGFSLCMSFVIPGKH